MTVSIKRIAVAAVLGLAATVAWAGPSHAIVPDYEIVEDDTSWDSDPYKSETVYCPSGTQVIGTGAAGAGHQVVMDDLIPYENRVYAFGYEDGNGFAGTWKLSAAAICADVDGYEIVHVPGVRDSITPKATTATCPGSKRVLGIGWAINGGYGEVGVTEVLPSTNYVRIKAYEQDSYSGNLWSVDAYAICAFAPAGISIHSSSTTDNSNVAQGKSQTCPLGKVQLGGGVNVVGGGGDIHISPFWPAGTYQGQSFMNATAYEDDDGTAATWHLTLHAICATA